MSQNTYQLTILRYTPTKYNCFDGWVVNVWGQAFAETAYSFRFGHLQDGEYVKLPLPNKCMDYIHISKPYLLKNVLYLRHDAFSLPKRAKNDLFPFENFSIHAHLPQLLTTIFVINTL